MASKGMDSPLPGYLYFDEDLHGGHYFIVGPSDPVDASNVVVFACTSQAHDRPSVPGCHNNHEFPSFFLGTLERLPKPTWVQLDDAYYYAVTSFNETHWPTARAKLNPPTTVVILECAAGSLKLNGYDAQACSDEAERLRKAFRL